MSKTRKVYFEPEKQRVKWTQTSSDNFKYEYKYIGKASEAEFDLLMELLWFIFDDREISFQEFKETYDQLRHFCDEIKGLVDRN
tara:strand:- start:520 stop:771 length:252 start_codon:yes stop_codon:yes gene_type:complete